MTTATTPPSDFEALDNFLDDYLELPVKGRDGQVRLYRIEDPSAEDGIKIERITSLAARLAAGGKAPATQVLGDEEELDLYRMCLGDAYELLMRDVKWGPFKHVALTAMFWVTTDKDTAKEFWKTGQHPGKASTPRNRQERRQASRDSSASATVNGTRSQASTSGTRAASRRRNKGNGRPPQT